MNPQSITVALADSFLESLVLLPRQQQRKVMKFVGRFRENPRASGINYETINTACQPNYRSVRIDQAYRGIVLKPETGNVYLLLWVDKHDDAYDWAARTRCEVHPETGVLQLYETTTQVDALPEPDGASNAPAAAKGSESVGRGSSISASGGDGAVTKQAPTDQQPLQAAKPLFDLTDDQYLKLGVPPALVETVKAFDSENALEAFERKLPVDAFEPLYLLAAGTPWDEIESDYLSREKNVDPQDVEQALERDATRRRFHVLENELELQQMLDAPLDRWRVFLHPAQRKLVARHWNGPVRVLGGAGTGKTVVAMHRAMWLVRNTLKQGERLLFLTFNTNLAGDIEANLRKIGRPEELARIEVINIDAWVSRFLRERGQKTRLIGDTDKTLKEIWEVAIDGQPSDPALPETFYREEFTRVILPQQIRTEQEYMRADRRGRGVALNRRQRVAVWPVFEEVRSQLHYRGLSTYQDATHEARALLQEQRQNVRYRSVVVDETQDMGAEALALIRTLTPEQEDDLFFVGDGHQRIYRRKVVMGRCGIEIRGRSRKLRVNYRTTEETRRFAMSILEDCEVDDLDGGTDSHHDYRSLVFGERPELSGYQDFEGELAGLVEQLRDLVASGVSPQEICVCARTGRLRDMYAEGLRGSRIEVQVLGQRADNASVPGVRLATMHRVKGLEFRYVFLAGLKSGWLPLPQALSKGGDPVEQREAELSERALLHVAASRASRKLFVSWHGERSPYLE